MLVVVLQSMVRMRYLVYLEYWTLNPKPLLVYPKALYEHLLSRQVPSGWPDHAQASCVHDTRRLLWERFLLPFLIYPSLGRLGLPEDALGLYPGDAIILSVNFGNWATSRRSWHVIATRPFSQLLSSLTPGLSSLTPGFRGWVSLKTTPFKKAAQSPQFSDCHPLLQPCVHCKLASRVQECLTCAPGILSLPEEYFSIPWKYISHHLNRS